MRPSGSSGVNLGDEIAKIAFGLGHQVRDACWNLHIIAGMQYQRGTAGNRAAMAFTIGVDRIARKFAAIGQGDLAMQHHHHVDPVAMLFRRAVGGAMGEHGYVTACGGDDGGNGSARRCRRSVEPSRDVLGRNDQDAAGRRGWLGQGRKRCEDGGGDQEVAHVSQTFCLRIKYVKVWPGVAVKMCGKPGGITSRSPGCSSWSLPPTSLPPRISPWPASVPPSWVPP